MGRRKDMGSGKGKKGRAQWKEKQGWKGKEEELVIEGRWTGKT
jgi:hypothetical protein